MPFVNLSVSHQNATHHAKNLKTLFVMLNVKNQIAKSTAQIRLVLGNY
jgi:hypothetical protein